MDSHDSPRLSEKLTLAVVFLCFMKYHHLSKYVKLSEDELSSTYP